jgi:lysophospholipase L1-like esterase
MRERRMRHQRNKRHPGRPTTARGSARTTPAGGPATLAAAAALLAGALTACDAAPGTETKGAPARQQLPVIVWDRSPGSVAAVGDSITRGFDTCTVLSDCPEASWSTGTDPEVQSLATRLIGAPAVRAGRAWNHARTGAEVAELPAQMTLAAANRPELVTVMIGANDACADNTGQMTPVADFRASFSAALRELRRTAPKAQVYVASVPDLKQLWSTGRDNPLSRQIWKLGICSTMLKDAEDLSAVAENRRERVRERVMAYNKVLKEECGRDERCRHDGGAVFAYRFGDEALSRWDWFHPSKTGQSMLAEIAHRVVTAARPPV